MPAHPDVTTKPELFIGMLSGTSRDGADIALLSFEDDQPALEHALCLPYPDALASRLRELIDHGKRPEPGQLDALHRDLGEFFASCVTRLLEDAGIQASQISAIGSHGQTVWHDPPESIQLGDPNVIASTTGITTVADLRRADLEAGGEGAPLAPLLHRAMFRPESGCRAVLNLGGIANLTILDSRGGVTGFDTVPGNCLMD
ncbi:MAG: anhydro-N-acetylmuramic acid kinase, partial [Xanthomonadales bacterium]|nr:anhydro-N-acetylmuramic acid kinase [Xanthomonadales bacterium]